MHERELHLLRRPRTVAVVASIGAVLAIAATVVGLSKSDDVPSPRTAAVENPAPARSLSADHDTRRVTQTAEPETFAVSVATSLFTWDTTAPTPLSEYTGHFLAVAAPSGDESAGLVTDLSTYLPSPESWEDLKTYQTRQWIDITSYEVPGEWKSAEFNGETMDLAEGTTAITVTGLRRRSGIWQSKPAQTVDEVSFTIFMTCQPTYSTCRLLRLSQLNKPLR